MELALPGTQVVTCNPGGSRSTVQFSGGGDRRRAELLVQALEAEATAVWPRSQNHDVADATFVRAARSVAEGTGDLEGHAPQAVGAALGRDVEPCAIGGECEPGDL